MKILRIKLRNLNSLHGEHVVDFTREPLEGCGIFAITGPTGAGKSTLLDAMTLALYGKAARYENDRNPENMMSRCTSDCLAEVTFSVNQQQYRAEWQLRRARGKVDGKIQPPVRFLYDSSNTPLNRIATECDEEIEKITGLDYPRFLRSVLLAQGEFSRFLKANAEERAALLESLTGTDVYTELGKLAHEETARREKELEAVRIALQQYKLLSEEEIAARKEIIGKDRDTLTALQAEQKMQQTLWQLAEQRQKTESDLQNLATQKADLEKEAHVNSVSLETWRMHQLAMPFARALLRCDHATATVNQRQQAHNQAIQDATAAQQQHALVLHHAITFATQHIAAFEASQQSVKQKISQIDDQSQAIRDWLATHTHWQGLNDQLPLLSERANLLRTLHSLQQQTQTQVTQGLADQQKNQQQLQQAHEAQHASHAILAQKKHTLHDAQQVLAVLCSDKEQTSESLREQTQQARLQTQRLLDAFLQEKNLTEIVSALSEKWQQAQRRLVEAQEKLHASEQHLDACTLQLRMRADHYHLAERQAGLEEHRAQLQNGSPCPLCGATEHPLAHGAAPSLTLDELLRAKEQSEHTQQEAQQQHNRLQASLIEAKTTATSLQEQLDARQQELATAQALRHAAGFADATRENLQSRIEELDHKQTAISAAVENERVAQLAQREAEAKWQIAQQRSQSLQQALEEHHSRQRQLQTTSQQRQQEIAQRTQELSQSIASYQLAMPDFSAAEFSLSEWEKAASHHPRAQQKRSTLDHEHEILLAQMQQLESQLADLKAHRNSWHEQASQQPPVGNLGPPPSWKNAHDAQSAHQSSLSQLEQCHNTLRLLQQQHDDATKNLLEEEQRLLEALHQSPFATIAQLRAALLPADEELRIRTWQSDWQQRQQTCNIAIQQRQQDLQALIDSGAPTADHAETLRETMQQTEQHVAALTSQITLAVDALLRDDQQRTKHAKKSDYVAGQLRELESWQLLRQLIGSHDGAKFRKFAQGISLDILIHHANRHLRQLSERYRLQRQNQAELTLEIIDLYQANTTRPMASLSGGETFIVSLALALGLSDLAGRNVQIDSLFIDEGFGTLDADALDTALSTLESLHQQNKTIGIISHIDLLKERIRTKINIRKLSAGSSTVEVA